LKNPMIFVFFRLTSSLNETTDYDLIGASFLKRYFFTLSSIAKHFTRLALNRTRLTGIQYAVINCSQSVVYAGDRRSNLVRHVPLEGKRPQCTESLPTAKTAKPIRWRRPHVA
jgi:hypothetical protein